MNETRLKNSDILWLKFSEDSGLPEFITLEQKSILNRIFDSSNPNAPWVNALERLGVKVNTSIPNIKWIDHTLYINWSLLVDQLSAGILGFERTENDGYKLTSHKSFGKLISFTRLQMKVSSYISRVTVGMMEKTITESLTLGLAILSLQLRLGGSDEKALAQSLKNPDGEDFIKKESLKGMQTLQKLRTELSPVWTAELGPSQDIRIHADQQKYPDLFWNDWRDQFSSGTEWGQGGSKEWDGIPISGASIVGKAVLVRDRRAIEQFEGGEGPLIAICPKARPETVELFPRLAGILYGEGGAMSHAATVARERNLPCITALGSHFIETITDYMASGGDVWLGLDLDSGKVSVVERK